MTTAGKYKCLWECNTCGTSCFPTTAESRCLCGHRLRIHDAAGHACNERKCGCKGFYYIPSEGSWMLRCRCKRKATEHDTAKPHKSMKPPLNGVVCTGFDSPWVCNCGCPWINHKQRFEEMQISACIIGPGIPSEMAGEGAGMEVLDAAVRRGGVDAFLRVEGIHEEAQKCKMKGTIQIQEQKEEEFNEPDAFISKVPVSEKEDPHLFQGIPTRSGGAHSNMAKENVLKKLNNKIKMMHDR